MKRVALAVVFAAGLLGCSDEGQVPPPDAGPDAPTAADSAPAADTGGDAGFPDAATGDAGPSLCPVKGYAACGGDLLGAWTFVSLCPEDQAKADALNEHPYDNLPACKDRTKNFVQASWVRNGTMTFDKTNVTIKYSAAVELVYGFTDACLAAARPGAGTPAAACTGMNKPGKLVCSYVTGLCTCTASLQSPAEDTTVPYTVSGNALTLSPGKETATWCRTGDVLIMDWTPHPISWRYWILKRQ